VLEQSTHKALRDVRVEAYLTPSDTRLSGFFQDEPVSVVSSDEAGYYEVSELCTGEYTLKYFLPGYAETHLHDLLLEKLRDYSAPDVELSPGAKIIGRITDKTTGKPLADSRIRINNFSGCSVQRMFRTDSSGCYEAIMLPAGENFLVIAWSPGYATQMSPRLQVTTGQVTTCNFALEQGGSIRGYVRDNSGRPVQQAQVTTWLEADLGERGSFRYGICTVSGEDGLFGFPHLLPDSYSLDFKAEGFAPAQRPGFEVVAQQSCDAGVIVLDRGKSITGRVLAGKTDAPVANAEVETSGPSIYPKSCRTDKSGRYSFAGLVQLQAMCSEFCWR